MARTVGQNIARICARERVTQVEFADRLRVRQPSVSKLLKARNVKTLTLLKVAKALACSVEELLEDVDTEYTPHRLGKAPAEASSRPMVQILPGYLEEDPEVPDEPAPEEMASPEETYDRIMGELVTLRGRIFARHSPVDGWGGSRSAESARRRRPRGRGKASEKTPSTRTVKR